MRKDNFAGYLMISPWLISFFAFALIPIAVISFYLAFTDYDILSPPNWVGTENFVRMFTGDARYIRSVKATFRYVFLAVPLRLMFALFVAMLLNTKRQGRQRLSSGLRRAFDCRWQCGRGRHAARDIWYKWPDQRYLWYRCRLVGQSGALRSGHSFC